MSKQLRAVVASRVSSLRGDSTSTSPDTQRTRGEAKALELGAVVVGHAEDLDVSAFSVPPWNRPKLSYWLNNPDLFDLLIVRSIDRLARRALDLHRMIAWADEHDVRLVFLDQELDLGTPLGKALAGLLGVLAELEVDMARESRFKPARDHMRRVGRWPSGRPRYGYRLCEHPSGKGYALEPDMGQDDESWKAPADVVREIVDRRLRGESRSSIARDLNARSIPSPEALWRFRNDKPVQGALWTGSGVSDVLTAPDGYGYGIRGLVIRAVEWVELAGKKNLAARGRKVPVRWEVVRDDDGEPVRYTNSPLISDAEWRKIKAIEAETGGSAPERIDSAPLVGILKCARCGHNLYRTSRYLKGGERKHLYQCMSRRLKNTACPGASVRQEDAMAVVESAWLATVGKHKVIVREETPGTDYSAEIAEEEDRLSELETDRYARGLFKGEAGIARFVKLHNEISERIERLRSIPATAGEVHVRETGWTYADEWRWKYEEEEPEDRFATLRRRNVAVYVHGKISDGPAEERMTYDATEWDTAIRDSVSTRSDWDEFERDPSLSDAE